MSQTKQDRGLVANRGVASAYELQADYDQLLKARQAQHGAPQPTVEALMYDLREQGMEALKPDSNRQRLSMLSREQVETVMVRLNNLRPRYPKITDELLLIVDRCRHE
jgi:hypothetical protein